MRNLGLLLRHRLWVVGFLAVLLGGAGSALAIPAFPGAEGFGANATGGRGGDVYHVTSLADTNTVGTLRYGISNAPTTGRTIVFDVAGTIALNSQITMEGGKITLAGQTAPGNGICIKNYYLFLDNDCDNTIIRHIRHRLGEDKKVNGDAITVAGGNNVIVDHCSTSWATDETLSVVEQATNVTIQWSLITESLNAKDHGYGSLIRPDADSNVTFHHDLYAHHLSRCPRPGTYNSSLLQFDFRNNVIYDWGDQAGYTNYTDEYVNMNYVGNYLVAGPSTEADELTDAFSSPGNNVHIYQSGNKIDGDRDGTFDGTDTGWAMFSGTFLPMGTAYAYPAVYTESADVALQRVLNEAGAFNWDRDPVDARVVQEVRDGTGHIIDTVSEVGGYPSYPAGTYTLSYDTDRDGMPNAWETARGLNPNAADNNGDDDADGYTNLEEYLIWLAPIPAPKAIIWTGGTAGRYELITNWDIPWQPTLADRTEINSGKAIVGYNFQEAGTLYVANTPAGSAELAVTAGKLTVGNALLVAYDVSTRGTISLRGGAISVGDRITLGGPNGSGARGVLNVTGGSLTAGGAIILASGSSSTGELRVSKGAYVRAGGLTINSGAARVTKVAVELASDGSSLIRTTAASTLGGAMDVQSLSGFRPREGDKFAVIASTDPNGVYYSGSFSTFTSNITLGLPGSSAFAGAADGADYELTFLGYTWGDANGDHAVNGGDLSLIGGGWGQGSQTWATGDFTGEGSVDGGDLALMGGNWMWVLPPGGAPTVPIPEPMTLALLAAGVAPFARRKRPLR